MQRLVRDDMRATTMVIVMFMINIVGMGTGPQIVGILSDALRPRLGADSLRWAMVAVSIVAFWSAYHFWRGGLLVEQDLAAMAEQPVSNELSGPHEFGLTFSK
jgi:hypothetical protein